MITKNTSWVARDVYYRKDFANALEQLAKV
jgi:hypothetical protein